MLYSQYDDYSPSIFANNEYKRGAELLLLGPRYYATVVQHYRKALSFLSQVPQKSLDDYKLAFNVQTALGDAYFLLTAYGKAKLPYQEAIVIFNKWIKPKQDLSSTNKTVAHAYISLGFSYIQEQDFTRAHKVYMQAYNILRDLPQGVELDHDYRDLSLNLRDLAFNMVQQQENAKALKIMNTAIKVMRSMIRPNLNDDKQARNMLHDKERIRNNELVIERRPQPQVHKPQKSRNATVALITAVVSGLMAALITALLFAPIGIGQAVIVVIAIVSALLAGFSVFSLGHFKKYPTTGIGRLAAVAIIFGSFIAAAADLSAVQLVISKHAVTPIAVAIVIGSGLLAAFSIYMLKVVEKCVVTRSV